MKGVTRIDDLSWINNLASELLIQRSLPIHENNQKILSSNEGRKDLILAKKLCQAKKKN